MKDIEVELTFPLKNAASLLERLSEAAALEKKDVFQRDTYYVPAHRDFLAQVPISEWLRLRESSQGVMMNYKHWHNKGNAQAVSCDEYESGISDVKAMKKILNALNFKPIVVVEKNRSIWMYEDVEIALDKVTGLGTYIELEAKGNFPSIDIAKERLHAVLKELSVEVGEQDYRGYPHLLLEKKGYHFLK